VMKDSVTVDDNVFPMLLSYNHADGLARAGDMLGPDFEYHLFTSATGADVTRDEFELACERIYNLERAIQVRNYGRQRADDETVLPHFERVEWWENPLLGEKVGLDRSKFLSLLERYYRLRGWDLERGRPTRPKLRQLGLEDVAQELDQAGLLGVASGNETPGARAEG
jgi:aldehyde:ferredoxin oxidoreductase